ncbi:MULTISPECIES: hypothetical protein [unclassified Mycobacterium]|uniref:hypothetical protein n=1 Tax=unclassified Mycobacterium TaxID=2642494 RepID=UPI0007FC914E|nr:MULTISPECIES: hypothetical protein [unclassified Mycobacterium]OBG58888.1 hypothetical protein A5703_03020 [Mycobacterium sp. E188]OBH37265.1 hypothetical protein A5691_26920 [Mycobacterium sp. E183]
MGAVLICWRRATDPAVQTVYPNAEAAERAAAIIPCASTCLGRQGVVWLPVPPTRGPDRRCKPRAAWRVDAVGLPRPGRSRAEGFDAAYPRPLRDVRTWATPERSTPRSRGVDR